MKNSFIEFLTRWGVVFAFVGITAIATEQALGRVSAEHESLKARLNELQQEKVEALKKNGKLKSQINSQSDVAWIEQVLKRELGLIPEGQTKVLFIPST